MLALVRRSQGASIYWVAAIAPGALPSYVTGLAPASPGQGARREIIVLKKQQPVCRVFFLPRPVATRPGPGL
jgi:hypothetical protein